MDKNEIKRKRHKKMERKRKSKKKKKQKKKHGKQHKIEEENFVPSSGFFFPLISSPSSTCIHRHRGERERERDGIRELA